MYISDQFSEMVYKGYFTYYKRRVRTSSNKLLNCRVGPIGNNYSKFKYNVRSQYRTKVL